MADTTIAPPDADESRPVGDPDLVLTEQQLAFYHTFGYLHLPGLMRDEFDEIEAGFEEVFAAKEFLEWTARMQGWSYTGERPSGAAYGQDDGPSGDIDQDPPWFETNYDLHFNRRRVTVPSITDRSDKLRDLPRHPLILSIATALMDGEFQIKASDGNLFYCDTSWHPDMYGAPLSEHHVKISMYLDPLEASSGAIRIIPGTHFHTSEFARKVRSTTNRPDMVRDTYGIEPDQVPSVPLASTPGDVVVWDYRTVHAAFNSGERRRLLSMNYGSTMSAEQIKARKAATKRAMRKKAAAARA